MKSTIKFVVILLVCYIDGKFLPKKEDEKNDYDSYKIKSIIFRAQKR